MGKKNVLEILDSVQYYLIVWILFFVPLLFLPSFEDPFRFSKIIFFYFLTVFLILTNAIKIFLEKKFFLPPKSVAFSIFFFVFIFFLSTLTSIHRLTSFFGIHEAYIGSFVHLVALLIFAFSVLQIDWTKRFYQVSVYISAAAAIASLFALEQFSQYFYDFAEIYRVRSTIGEPNRLGFFLSAALPFCLFLFLTSKQKWVKFINFFNCLLVLATILLTFSRSCWIGLFLTFIIIIFILLLFLKKEIKPAFEKIVRENKFYLIILVILTAFFLPSLGKKVLDRNLSVIEDLRTGGGSVNIRLQNWQVVWKTVKNREKWHQHFLGTGPSTIAYTFLKNRPVSFNRNLIEKDWITVTVRNQFLDLLTNVGILGLISFLAILTAILFYIYKNIKKFAKRAIFWPIFSCFLVIFFTSFFYYQTIETSIYFWFGIDLLMALSKRLKVGFKKISRLAILVLGGYLFFICLFILVRITLADLALSNGKYKEATGLNPYNDFYQRQLAYYLLQQTEEKKDLEKAKLAIEAAQKATRLNSISSLDQYVLQVTNYRIGVLFDKKFHQVALEAGEKRISLDPTHAGPYDTQGLVYLDLGRLEEALKHFQKAIEVDPDYAVSYLHVGETLKQMGKIDEAIEYYQKALEKDPNWPFAEEELQKVIELKKKGKNHSVGISKKTS